MSNVLFKGNAVDIEGLRMDWELFNADETSRSLQDEVSKALLYRNVLFENAT